MGTIELPWKNYRKTLLTKAIQATPATIEALLELPDINVSHAMTTAFAIYYVDTLEGNMMFELWDWIAEGVQGEHYPIKKSIFDEIYVRDDG